MGTPPKRASMGKRRRPGAQSKKRQAQQAFAVSEPCGGISDAVVRAAGLEPAHRMATEPKSVESTNSTTPAYERQTELPLFILLNATQSGRLHFSP